MRKNASFEEHLLWSRLRKKQVDGEQHRVAKHSQADERRDAHLRERYDVEVLRVSAAQVRQNIDAVVETIEEHLAPG